MKARQFFDKVSEMRRLQREYFKTRDKNILCHSIQVEKEIDDEIERVNNIMSQRNIE